jgi:CO dehydrogenase/acetyl-CoA synthase delta subunit
MDVYDKKPDNWPDYISSYYEDVSDDPLNGLRRVSMNLDADAVCFHLTKVNPDIGEMNDEQAGELVKKYP